MVLEALPPQADESRVADEWLQLVGDPIFYGIGAPRGDGRAVLVLPGLFGNDTYLTPLRMWLWRIGYRPIQSSLDFNAGCSNRITQQIERELHANWRPGAPLAIIGHSRGGILGRTIAARLQDNVSHLIALGSPVGALMQQGTATFDLSQAPPLGRMVAEAGMRAREILDPNCNFPECGCPFAADQFRAMSDRIRITSIFSPGDQVVSRRMAPIAGARNVEVRGSHVGLAFNRDAYRAIAAALADR